MSIFGYGRVSTLDQDSQNQKLEIERAGHRGVLVRGSGGKWRDPSLPAAAVQGNAEQDEGRRDVDSNQG